MWRFPWQWQFYSGSHTLLHAMFSLSPLNIRAKRAKLYYHHLLLLTSRFRIYLTLTINHYSANRWAIINFQSCSQRVKIYSHLKCCVQFKKRISQVVDILVLQRVVFTMTMQLLLRKHTDLCMYLTKLLCNETCLLHLAWCAAWGVCGCLQSDLFVSSAML